jgi:hypothetical protein
MGWVYIYGHLTMSISCHTLGYLSPFLAFVFPRVELIQVQHIYSTNVAYCTSATFIKLSILYQYLRLFSETAPSTTCARYRLARRLTWVLVVLSSVWGVAFVLLAAFSCSPIAKNWNATLPGRCVGWGTKDPDEFFAMFLGHSISNLVLDIVVLLLPVPFLSMLRIGGKSKAGLITLFSLGCM